MAKEKKTIQLKTLIDVVNRRNKHSTCNADVRQGWNALLEEALHLNNAYAGFGYYDQREVPGGHKPGIRRSESELDGLTFHDEKWTHKDRFTGTDESRRYYYLSHKIR